ncbi:hypothetical protein T07_4834 [Trichinella nelsoni]|uniref:Uncharacterized protein n=1 Tax=Trichinella nelsoni TaxID=6336 RepID=A0A0V0S1K1_9BILA|nr:hypothetical protein T07_4834 [Trichinella nelsoni]
MEDYADFLKWEKASMKALNRAVSGQHDEKVGAGFDGRFPFLLSLKTHPG